MEKEFNSSILALNKKTLFLTYFPNLRQAGTTSFNVDSYNIIYRNNFKFALKCLGYQRGFVSTLRKNPANR